MKISIITPTEERAHYLKGLYGLLKRQTFSNWEWLIYDTSLRPFSIADERVRYFHDTNIVSVGEKRNRLAEKAKGDVIVHCDDDDYYAPQYLERVAKELKSCDFFNIDSWFSYQRTTEQFYYWDTNEESKSHFMVDPITEMQVREIDFGPYFGAKEEQINRKGKRGYGFSFAYLKKVWQACPFPDKDLAEDRTFYDDVDSKGFKIRSVADQKGIVVHVVHTSNMSKVYPQYRIPKFLVEPLFSDFFSYLKTVSDEN